MNNGRKIPTIDDLIALPEPNDAQISPDGRFVTYTLTKPDFDNNEYLSQIWLVANEENATPRQLTFANQSSQSPRWSPDGQWLAFISKRAEDDEAQIYRLALQGGESERLTELKTGPSQIAWSPDGARIAFIAADPETEADKERKKKYGDYTVENEDYQYNHLWLLEIDSKKCRKVTGGKQFHVYSFDWSPDSKRIAFDPAQKYPLLVVIHGGPAWVSLRAMLLPYDRRLYPVPQWLARGIERPAGEQGGILQRRPEKGSGCAHCPRLSPRCRRAPRRPRHYP